MNNNDILIDVQHVSKRFCKDLKRSMRYGFMDSLRAIAGRDATATDLRKDEFWAVKDVSFQLRRGECLGLIGHNGAGKSTLLKMLNGLINPDQGSITMRGKIGALIELGAGFNPILTGRENIYNNGAVLGFSRSEIDAKVEAIIDFAEIRDFIDSPVQNYSSGMRVRLGFAVAAQMEPDILLIDEVLAVGDLGFRVKCMNRIQELLKNTAVIFVSHSMTQITTVCTDLILMDNGKVEYNGVDLGFGVELYFKKFNTNEQQIITSKNVKLIDVALNSEHTKNNDTEISLNSGSVLNVKFKLEVDTRVKRLKFRIGIFNIEYRLLAEVDSDQVQFVVINPIDGIVEISVDISELHLRYGKYSIHLHVIDADSNEKLLRQSDIATFYVKHTLTVGADFLLPSKWTQVKI